MTLSRRGILSLALDMLNFASLEVLEKILNDVLRTDLGS